MGKAKEFKNYNYIIVKKLIARKEISEIYQYTLQNLPYGNLTDDQVPGSPSFYQDKKIATLHQQLVPKIESLLDLKLLPSFCYYRTYRRGAILRAHKDRSACEIAMSLNLGQQGELWDLWLLDNDENPIKITLSPGDAVIYRGGKLMHWRGKLVDADYVSQAFLFFVKSSRYNRLILRFEEFKKFLKYWRRFFGITSY